MSVKYLPRTLRDRAGDLRYVEEAGQALRGERNEGALATSALLYAAADAIEAAQAELMACYDEIFYIVPEALPLLEKIKTLRGMAEAADVTNEP